MTPSAIHQAIRLNKYPKEMAWLCQSSAELPRDITALLRLCSSHENINEFALKNHTDTDFLQQLLLDFIDKVLLNKNNSNEKILGLKDNTDDALRKLHYQLLIKIYHPDRNLSPKAADKTVIIVNAYNELKKQKTMNEYKNIRISRVPPKSFYTATQKAEQQISGTKSAFISVLAIAILALIWGAAYLYESPKQELYTQKPTLNLNKQDIKTDQIINNSDNQFSMARQSGLIDINNNQNQLHHLLAEIEIAYEKGDAGKIQKLLNSPEIKEQSDKEVFNKLRNLFNITSERKMLLYDFEWTNLSGQIKGKGKFLSRYHLNKQDQWLTREGIASIMASKDNNKLNIKSLKLDNKNIDQ